MIVVEDPDSKSPNQVQVRIVPDATGLDGTVQPQPSPAAVPSRSYTLSYHTTPLLAPSYPVPSTHCHNAAPSQSQSPVKRFWKAFAFALLIYLAFLSLARSIVYMASGGIVSAFRVAYSHHPSSFHSKWDDDGVGVPKAEDGRILESIGSLSWTTYQARPHWAPTFSESAETSFVLPSTAEALYLISRGSYQTGKVEVKQSTTTGRGNDVKVDVRVAYHDERALARATVCRLRKSGNRHGVGVYVCFFSLFPPSLPCALMLAYPSHTSHRHR